MILMAKINGIIPDELTFNGMYVVVPPKTRLPRIRFAYWTMMRRCPSLMKMMDATIPSPITPKKISPRKLVPETNDWPMDPGKRAMIPAKIRRLMPFPTPFSVIISPSHTRNMVPAVRVKIMETVGKNVDALISPKLEIIPSRANKVAWAYA